MHDLHDQAAASDTCTQPNAKPQGNTTPIRPTLAYELPIAVARSGERNAFAERVARLSATRRA